MGHHAHRMGMRLPKIGKAPKSAGIAMFADGGDTSTDIPAKAPTQAIGNYLADLNKRITAPVNWSGKTAVGGGGAGGTGGGGGGGGWAMPGDFPSTGTSATGTTGAGSTGVGDALSGIAGIGLGAAKVIKATPAIKNFLGLGFDPNKFATSDEARTATDQLQTQLDAIKNMQIPTPISPFADLSGYNPNKPFVSVEEMTPEEQQASADRAAQNQAQPQTSSNIGPLSTAVSAAIPTAAQLFGTGSNIGSASGVYDLEGNLLFGSKGLTGAGSALSGAGDLAEYVPSRYVSGASDAASGAGSAANALSLGSKWADIGAGALGSALVGKLASGNETGSIGSALGSAALSIPAVASGLGLGGIGSQLGWMAGPVGALAGGVLGTVLGGFLGDSDPLTTNNPFTGKNVVVGKDPLSQALYKYNQTNTPYIEYGTDPMAAYGQLARSPYENYTQAENYIQGLAKNLTNAGVTGYEKYATTPLWQTDLGKNYGFTSMPAQDSTVYDLYKNAWTQPAKGATGGSVSDIQHFADGGATNQPGTYQQQYQNYWNDVNQNFGPASAGIASLNTAAPVYTQPQTQTSTGAINTSVAPDLVGKTGPAFSSTSFNGPQTSTPINTSGWTQTPNGPTPPTGIASVAPQAAQAQQGWYDPTSKLTNVQQMAQKLGVTPDEIMNIGNLYRTSLGAGQGGAPEGFDSTQKAVDYMLGQGNNSETVNYIKQLIDRAKLGASHLNSGTSQYATGPAYWGYDKAGNYVGDVAGGKAVADNRMWDFDPKTITFSAPEWTGATWHPGDYQKYLDSLNPTADPFLVEESMTPWTAPLQPDVLPYQSDLNNLNKQPQVKTVTGDPQYQPPTLSEPTRYDDGPYDPNALLGYATRVDENGTKIYEPMYARDYKAPTAEEQQARIDALNAARAANPVTLRYADELVGGIPEGPGMSQLQPVPQKSTGYQIDPGFYADMSPIQNAQATAPLQSADWSALAQYMGGGIPSSLYGGIMGTKNAQPLPADWTPRTFMPMTKPTSQEDYQPVDWSNVTDWGQYAYAEGGNVKGYAEGGIAGVPEYAAGGKFLRGKGDGMSDSIPAMIHGNKPQQAALADGEFVVPADVVSHLGNGSSEAGSRKLYQMMDKIRMARTGRKAQGKKINPDKFLPG